MRASVDTTPRSPGIRGGSVARSEEAPLTTVPRRPRLRTRIAAAGGRRATRAAALAAILAWWGLVASSARAEDGAPAPRPFCPSDDPALTQEPAPWTPAAVNVLLLAGFRERQRGFDEAARGHFVDAYRGSGDARALAQLALAEQALGRPEPARRHLEEALDCVADPWIARNQEVLAGALTELDAALVRAEAEAAAREAARVPPPSGPGLLEGVPTASWVALGTAGALLVAAIGTGAGQRAAQRDLDAACPDPRACPDGARDARDRARRLAAATDALGTTSLLAATTAVVLWLVDARPWAPRDAGTTAAEPRFGATCGFTGCAATLEGRF